MNLATSLLHGAALAALLLLGGCSALQVDVDVYKGALANEPEIQARQFAALPSSAQPVLKLMSQNRLRCDQQQALFTILAFYEPIDSAKDQELRKRVGVPFFLAEGRSVNEDDCLKAEVQTEALGGSWSNGGRHKSGLGQLYRDYLDQLTLAQGDLNHPKVRAMQAELVDAYVVFAERMLFVVNNSTLFQNDQSVERSVLQTVGNSILLHANDLRRRDNHDRRQTVAFKNELDAAKMAHSFLPPLEAASQFKTALDKAAADAKQAALKGPELLKAKTEQAAVEVSLRQAAAEIVAADQALKSWNQEPLRAAYVTLVQPAAKPVFGPSAPLPVVFDAAAAAADKAKIEAIVRLAGSAGNIDGIKLRDALKGWIAQQDLDPRLVSDRLLRLRALDAFLAKGLSFESFAAQAADGLLDTIRKEVEQRKTDAEKDWAGALARRAEAGKASETVEERLKTAKKTVETELVKAQTAPAVVQAQEAANKGKAELDKIARSDLAVGMTTPEAFRGTALSALARVAEGLKDAELAAVTAVIETVKKTSLLPNFPHDSRDYSQDRTLPGASARPAQAIDVVDDVIALLRNKRIRALAEGKTAEAADLQVAIDAAYEQRTSLVYVRPAVEYLRNVYSATALQDDSSSAHPNLLLNYIRKLGPSEDKIKRYGAGTEKPVLSQIDAYGSGGQTTDDSNVPTVHEARRQLEKVFWQNINRVTLAGGGLTNYVLAKDDVGNWYVKAYGSDPKQIFESAKNLALFNKGAAIDVNLLERSELRRQASDPALSETERGKARDRLEARDKVNPAALSFAQKTQERSLANFSDEQVKLANELAAQIDKLGNTLVAAWRVALKDSVALQADQLDGVVTKLRARIEANQGSLPESNAAMRKSATALSADKDAKDPKVARSDALARDTLASLDALRALRSKLMADVAAVVPTLDPKPDAKDGTNLVAAVRRALRDIVDAAIKKHQRAAETYLDSLGVLGDVVAGK